MDEKTILKFKKYSHYNLYIKKSDLSIYKKHSTKILVGIHADPSIPLGVRNRKVAGEIKKLMTGFFTNEDFSDKEGKVLLENASSIIEDYIKDTCKDKKILEAVEAIAGEHMTNYTHSRNVATYSTLFGLSQGVGTPEELHMGGLLHDIGMSDLPESMLWTSENQMDEKELAQFKLHPGNAKLEISSRKLKISEGVMNMITQHHECPDGSGFPYGLTSDKIDPLAKICTFADEFDRLTSVREGQKLFTPVAALDRISGKDGEDALPFYEKDFHAKLVTDFSDGKPLSLEVPEISKVTIEEMSEEIPDLDQKTELTENIVKKDPDIPIYEVAKTKKEDNNKDYINSLLNDMEDEFNENLSDMNGNIDLLSVSSSYNNKKFNDLKSKELFAFAKSGDVVGLQKCLDEGANINVQDESGNTALMLAVQNHHEAVVSHLMEEGASLDVLNKLNQTAIDIAQTSKQKTLIDEMEKYKHKNIVSKNNTHPEATVNLVNENKEFNINQRNKQGQTLLMQLCAKGNFDGAKKFINMGADVKVKDFKGHTPLIFASNQGHLELVKLLIENGVDIDVKDGSGRSALLHAIEHKRTDVTEELLKRGARLDLRLNGLTMLMIAAYTGQEKIVKLLLDYGVHVTDKDIKGKTAIEYALAKGHLNIAEMINGGPLKKSS
ncbi:MAG: ankyrin repeat domain-containing protein [Bdellovibrionaceae bacterium]|nr:ankyrin repeat domain-containing protein [Pseudobdellovibrionaceae bacterium]